MRNGPFDGAMGFDMGGEFLVHVAGLATEGDPDLKDLCWPLVGTSGCHGSTALCFEM